jgi:hypothetical protein
MSYRPNGSLKLSHEKKRHDPWLKEIRMRLRMGGVRGGSKSAIAVTCTCVGHRGGN